MTLDDILYSVNTYDKDGDVTDEGIFLHFGDTRIKVANDLTEFKLVTKRISSMVDEIQEYGIL